MTIGRRELSVAVLTVATLVFYLVFLSTTPSGAQINGGTTSNDDEGCPGAEFVDEFVGDGNQTTPTFSIAGDSFRISYDATSDTDSGGLIITVNDDQGDFVDSVSEQGSGSGESFVNEGPGQFFLEIAGIGVEYTVTIEDCTESGNDNNDNNDGNNNNGNTNDDNVINNDNNGEITTQNNDDNNNGNNQNGQRTSNVVNIPNKPLPPTGGLPTYAMVAGSVFAGVGLLSLGIAVRRGRR